MGECRECRWWSADETPVAVTWGACALTVYPPTAENHETWALAVTQAGNAADLITRADFGCVQFEAREG